MALTGQQIKHKLTYLNKITELIELCFIAVYDVTSKETFNKLEEWLSECDTYSTKTDVVKMLVGNKIDRVNTCLLLVTIYKIQLFAP